MNPIYFLCPSCGAVGTAGQLAIDSQLCRHPRTERTIGEVDAVLTHVQMGGRLYGDYLGPTLMSAWLAWGDAVQIPLSPGVLRQMVSLHLLAEIPSRLDSIVCFELTLTARAINARYYAHCQTYLADYEARTALGPVRDVIGTESGKVLITVERAALPFEYAYTFQYDGPAPASCWQAAPWPVVRRRFTTDRLHRAAQILAGFMSV